VTRGLLRFKSARAPYRRAGLAWAGREPVERDIHEFDGGRLLALLKDPVVTITIGREDGTFGALPTMPADIDAEQLQMMIDGMAADLPPIGAETSVSAPSSLEEMLLDAQDSGMRLASALEAAKNREAAIVELLAGAGFETLEALFETVEALISAHSSKVSEVSSLTSQLATAQGTITSLTNERDGATTRVVELEKEVGALTATAKAPPKPGGKKSGDAGTDAKS
jgi:hypothetical protein